MSPTKILVVAGVGNGSGTGAAVAREFAKVGYAVALISRSPDELKKIAEQIKTAGGAAEPFPVASYNPEDIRGSFDAIKKHWPNGEIRVAVWNAAFGVWKGFLDVTDEEVQKTVLDNIIGPFAFSKEAILAFKGLELNEHGARGSLIFTSATAAWRGNKTTSSFSAGKHAQKALAQSLNKEFGVQNIHVANVIVDGLIVTDRTTANRPGDASEDKRLKPEAIAKTYIFLAHQERSAWTFELDLRPAHETW